MGETATDTRLEIERTRAELSNTLSQLRSRTVVVRGKVIRIAAIAGGVLATAGAGAVGVVLVRRRRGGRLVQATRRLPDATHSTALPVARAAQRWADRRAERTRDQRDRMVEMISAKIAENQAQAERKANPLWRRTVSKGLETAATVGIAALVRRAFNEPTGRGIKPARAVAQPEKELIGAGKGDHNARAAGAEAEALTR